MIPYKQMEVNDIRRTGGIAMNRLQENTNAAFRTIQGIKAETNLSRKLIMQIAKEAGAIVRYGRVIRIDAERFYVHLRKDVD